jgi:STE24 endopeptidase
VGKSEASAREKIPKTGPAKSVVYISFVGIMPHSDNDTQLTRAKQYSRAKYSLAIIDTAYLLILLFLFLALGLSRALAEWTSKVTAAGFLDMPLYLLAVLFIYAILDFPLNLYRTFLLEHKFSLSNQKFGGWLLDQLKAGVISYIIILVLLAAFYYLLKRFPAGWWLAVSAFWIFFSLVLARLTPIIIVPLFFKYKRLADENLRQRIIGLAGRMKVKILDVFEIDFSNKTLKANAAFVGIGSTRRVILADTLKDKYNYDEIEVILAHEFSHYRLRHIFKLIAVNAAAAIFVFYLIFKTSGIFLGAFGLPSLSSLAALPVVLIYFVIFAIFTQPFENYFSRRLERNADTLALKATGLKEAFISMMEKLSDQNLSDRKPHPVIKFFFFDHPPTDERILMARNFEL